jgi:PAP2 superfamily protein
MVQYTINIRWLKIAVWINFGVTAIATLYFGWHYIADDVAGILIALVSFYIGGLASGQKFEGRGLRSHPTTTTSVVPVLHD